MPFENARRVSLFCQWVHGCESVVLRQLGCTFHPPVGVQIANEFNSPAHTLADNAVENGNGWEKAGKRKKETRRQLDGYC